MSVAVVNLVAWLYILLGPSWCVYVCCTVIILIPNSATDIHHLGPNNIGSHTIELTTTMCFNWLF